MSKTLLRHTLIKKYQSYSIVSMRQMAKTNNRMKPFSKCLQKGNDHDRKTLPLHECKSVRGSYNSVSRV